MSAQKRKIEGLALRQEAGGRQGLDRLTAWQRWWVTQLGGSLSGCNARHRLLQDRNKLQRRRGGWPRWTLAGWLYGALWPSLPHRCGRHRACRNARKIRTPHASHPRCTDRRAFAAVPVPPLCPTLPPPPPGAGRCCPVAAPGLRSAATSRCCRRCSANSQSDGGNRDGWRGAPYRRSPPAQARKQPRAASGGCWELATSLAAVQSSV